MNAFIVKTVVKMVLLVGLGGFLASRLFNSTLNFYIHPRFNGLTLATAVLLAALGAIYGWQMLRHGGEHHHHDVPWLGLFILALPIVLGLFVTPQPLGANALGNRELTFRLSAAPDGSLRTATIETGGTRNILDWLYAFQQEQEPSLFNGQEVDVIGFVYRDEQFSDSQFMVSRFTISCCVADANPIGLIVQWPEAASLAENDWVRVSGRFQAESFNGSRLPVIQAESVTPTDAPKQPYLYE